MKKKVRELLAMVDAKNEIDPEPYWGLPRGRPTKEQIQGAIDAGKLTPWPGGGRPGPHNQGDEAWHLGRIAWLVLNWGEGLPNRAYWRPRPGRGAPGFCCALQRLGRIGSFPEKIKLRERVHSC